MFIGEGVSLFVLWRLLEEKQALEGVFMWEEGVSEWGFFEGEAEGSTLGFLSGGESSGGRVRVRVGVDVGK